MELQQLRYVVAVAETRHFTKAADRCHVVQSALSHQIAALERELGFTLFARSSRRVELTTAGVAFLPHARASLEAAERAVVEGAAALGETRGTLTIGAIPTISSVDMAQTLAEYRHAYPQVGVSLRVDGCERLIDKVRAGEVDVAFVSLPDPQLPAGIGSRQLARERLVGIVSRTHPLAGLERVPLEKLASQPFADFPAGTAARAQSDRIFDAADLTRTVAYETTTVDLMIEVVATGLVVALLPESVASRAQDRVAAVTITPSPQRFEHLIWNDFNPSPAALAFLDQLTGNRPSSGSVPSGSMKHAGTASVTVPARRTGGSARHTTQP